jgi:hypothetical protein
MNPYKPMIAPEKVRIFQLLMAAASVPLTDRQAQGLVEFFAMIAADAVDKVHKEIIEDMQRELPALFEKAVLDAAEKIETAKVEP